MTDKPQGTFHVKRRIDGSMYFKMPPEFATTPQTAIQLAQAILKEAGVETIMANPGQTVIRPPARKLLA